MQLTDHMRKHLIDGVIAAQKTNSPLFRGLNLQRLQHTLEQDITEEELSSIMLLVGASREESIRAMCLTLIDRNTSETATTRTPSAEDRRRWKAERNAQWARLKHLTHRKERLTT